MGSEPLLSPGLGHRGGDGSACALSCLCWGSPGTWSLAWCPQGEAAGVMLCLSSEIASLTSPGQYNHGECALCLTAGELSFLLFLFLFAFITLASVQDKWILKKSMPVSCSSRKATSSAVNLMLKKTLRPSTDL